MGNPFGETPKATSADVRKVFLQDFLNDTYTALNVAINTGAVDVNATGTAPSSTAQQSTTFNIPANQTQVGKDLSQVRQAKQKAVQAKIDQLSNPQYAQPKPLTPSQKRQAKQASAAAKVDAQTKQQNAQTATAKKAATKDPATVLEAFDILKEMYLPEQSEDKSLSNFLVNFFDDYVAGANVDYSKYKNQIKTMADQFEKEYQINPKGLLGGYSKNLRSILTQLGDLALLLYNKGRRQRETPQTSTATSGKLSTALDTTVGDYINIDTQSSGGTNDYPSQGLIVPVSATENEPYKFGGETYYQSKKGWVDSKGKAADKNVTDVLNRAAGAQTATVPKLTKNQIDSYIRSLSPRQKQQLVNYIVKQMPAGQDLKYF